MKYISMLKEIKLWNNGYVQMWNFSKSNSCQEAREEAILEIVKVCRGDKEIKNPNLYKHLLTEHAGKPGEAFQFVPAIHDLINPNSPYITEIPGYELNRFGLNDQNNHRVLGNLRMIITDKNSGISKDIYNEQVSDFYVFKMKVPIMIVPHLLKHGQLSFMQQSERYCKLREYFYCDELEPLWEANKMNYEDWDELCYNSSQWDWDLDQSNYGTDLIRQELTNKGSHGLAYTTLWIAGWKQDLSGFQNFFNVRLGKGTQKETRELAQAMKDLMEYKNYLTKADTENKQWLLERYKERGE